MTKILENKSMMIHIGVEIVAIMGIMFVNNRRNSELKSRVEQLEQVVVKQSEVIKSMQEYLKNTIDNNQMSSVTSSVSSALSSFKDEYDEKLLSVIERVEEIASFSREASREKEASLEKEAPKVPHKRGASCDAPLSRDTPLSRDAPLPRDAPSRERDSRKHHSLERLLPSPPRFKSVKLEEPDQIKIKIFPVVSHNTRSNVEIIDEETDASQEEKEQLERELAEELAELQEE